jgi:hypothetical protein
MFATDCRPSENIIRGNRAPLPAESESESEQTQKMTGTDLQAIISVEFQSDDEVRENG